MVLTSKPLFLDMFIAIPKVFARPTVDKGVCDKFVWGCSRTCMHAL